jgi:hypothetical protein
LWDSCNYNSWESAIHRFSLNSTVLIFALSVCLNTLSSRKYKSFAVLQEFGHSKKYRSSSCFFGQSLYCFRSHQLLHRLSLKPNLCWCCFVLCVLNLCWCCFVLCVLNASNWKTECCLLGTRLACEFIGCGFVGSNDNHCQWILECYPLLLATLTEIALSHLDTQWGFRDNTPVEGRWGIHLCRNTDRRALYVSKSAP